MICARMMNCATLSTISTQQAAATASTAAAVHQLLDYVATYLNDGITYQASTMVLAAHSDASFLTETGPHSRAGAHIFLSDDDPVPRTNGPVLTLSQTIKFVMASAAKAKLAAAMLFASPGTSYLYYGEEIGMSQYKTGDDQYRRAIMQWADEPSAGFNSTANFWLDQGKWFPWVQNHEGWFAHYWQGLQGKGLSVAAQSVDENSLLNHYKRLIAVRNANPVLKQPDEIRYYPVENQDVWLVEALGKIGSVWVVINLNSTAAAEVELPKSLQGARTEKLSGKEINLTERITLQPAEALIF